MTTPLPKILLLFATLLCFSHATKCYATENDSLEVKEVINWINKQYIGSNEGNKNLLLIETPINPKVNTGCVPLKGIDTKDSVIADSLYRAGINFVTTYKWKGNLVDFAKIITDSMANHLLSGEGNTAISPLGIFYCQPYIVPSHPVAKARDYSQKKNLPMLWLSYPIFSNNKKYALIRFQYHCGSLCGNGYTYILKKERNGQWLMVWGCGYVN